MEIVNTFEIPELTEEELIKIKKYKYEIEQQDLYNKFIKDLPDFFTKFGLGLSNVGFNLIDYNKDDTNQLYFKKELEFINFDNTSGDQTHYTNKDLVFKILEAVSENKDYEFTFMDKIFNANSEKYKNKQELELNYNSLLNNLLKDLYSTFLYKKSGYNKFIYSLINFFNNNKIVYPTFYEKDTIVKYISNEYQTNIKNIRTELINRFYNVNQ